MDRTEPGKRAAEAVDRPGRGREAQKKAQEYEERREWPPSNTLMCPSRHDRSSPYIR